MKRLHHEAILGAGASTLIISGGFILGVAQANAASLKAKLKRRKKKGLAGENK